MLGATPNMTIIDLEYLGQTQVIASCVLESETSVAIVDPGPSSAAKVLRSKLTSRGLSVADIDAILLTHIHLDHAGATGNLVRENPRIRVFIHPNAARHMVDPSRLIRSAARLYGNNMDRFWGEILPVPGSNLRILSDREVVHMAGRTLEVAYTPGHASHHVSYLDKAAGLAFVGDTAGIRIANGQLVLPVTPPPDIHLEDWYRSLERIQEWRPEQLFLTHFGPATGVTQHFAELRALLREWGELVRSSLQNDETDAKRASSFARHVGAGLRHKLSEEETARYTCAAALDLCWYGLARYWRKQNDSCNAAR